MGQITGGHVLYSRKTKPGDYEHEQADVLFNFTVDDGGDPIAMAAKAGDLARQQARRLLGFKDAQPKAVEVAPAPKVEVVASQGDKGKLAAAVTGGAPAAVEVKAEAKPKQPPKTAKKAEEPKPEPAKPAADAAEIVDDDLTGAGPVEITDQQLLEAVTQRNQAIKNPAKIKALTGKYVGGPPKTIRDIPQELRTKYLEELAALTADAA